MTFLHVLWAALQQNYSELRELILLLLLLWAVGMLPFATEDIGKYFQSKTHFTIKNTYTPMMDY